jgi:hypothetical protein
MRFRAGSGWVIAGLSVLGLAACGRSQDSVDLSRYVFVYPGSSIVELPSESATMTVSVRNVSVKKLTKLQLEIKSEACRAEVKPETILQIVPGDRRSFAVTLTRTAGKARQRYPLYLTLRSPDLPVAAGMDLIVDLAPPRGDRWVDVGQVKLIARKDTRTVYYLLAGVPLLFIAAWLLWRISRPTPKKPPEPEPPDEDEDADDLFDDDEEDADDEEGDGEEGEPGGEDEDGDVDGGEDHRGSKP